MKKKSIKGRVPRRSSPWLKRLLIMKMIVILLLVVGLTTSYAKSDAQTTKLNLKLKSAMVKDVIEEIERQTDLSFMYDNSVFKVDRQITINVENETVKSVVEKLISGENLKYEMVNRYIVITENSSLPTSQQQKSVSGKVSDSNGGSLPGVTVVVKGTTVGTITDSDGKYSISNIPANAVLQFSFVGMKTQEISVGSQTTINVTLADETIGLEEVVAVGYGTQKKATITGSVSTVSGEKLTVAKSVNFTNSLAGQIPGLVAVTRSGQPGADDATLRIRGNNTLNDNSPLFVVDGIANRSMSRLNSADIESVTVLKDASAAIYGAQAANGVILITTKRGSTGKLKISVNFNQGFSTPTVLPDMADSYTYATMMNEMDTYAGQTPRFTANDIQKFQDGSDPWGHPNTNWFKEVFKPYSLENTADINLSGGTESLKYFVSIGSRYQDGAYRESASNYSQVDFRSNIDGKISKDISFSIDLAGRQENRDNPVPGKQPIFRMIPRGKPTEVARWFNGLPGPDIESDMNPVVMVTDLPGTDKDKRYIMESNLKLKINIPWVEGLSISSNASIDKNFQTDKLWQIPYYLYTWDKQTLDTNGLPLLSGSKRGLGQPQLNQSMANGQQVTLNFLVNYEHRIAENHKIKILVGSESSEGKSMNFSALRKYFVSSAIDELFAGSDLEKDNNGSASENARLNYFGRLNYDYLSKYLVEFVWRYDGSYIFPADKRWGFFPGFSLGWLASEENFWKNNLSFINYFKLRGSWGQTGNDRINNFQYLSTYGFGGVILNTFNGNEWVTNVNVKNKVLNEQQIPNLNVTWEIANQTNIGFDAKMLGGKLTLEGNYFHNLRKNILTKRNASVPTSAGLTLPPENIGEVVNQGFEFVIAYRNKVRSFDYSISANGGYAKNKIKFWDETPGIPDYQQTTGHPMNSELYYQAIGIFKDQAAVDAYPHWIGARPGDIIFKDVNDDGKINALDQVRDYRSDIPTFTGGLSIDLAYKNFYATILFQGALGRIRYHSVEGGEPGNYYMEDAIGRWTADNPDATKPRAFNYTAEYWNSSSSTTVGKNTYWLRNADYVRLKNIEIGYNVPKTVNTKLGIDGLRIYVNGLNFITWCPGLKSFDPESTYQDYPLSKVINIGASVNF